ncbi:MAG: alpha-L-fucosidase [Bacteroidetes bacterium]|nr:alpha-L-fucosidase [Bacteroidota bacterium]
MKTYFAAVALVLMVFSGSIHGQTWTEMNASKKESFEWFNEAKFGMFIHWGLYSIPGGEWDGKRIESYHCPCVAEWIQHAAEVPRTEYRKLMEQFNPVEFDADYWASLAANAGMKYIILTSKHHDGFALFDSKVSDFDVMGSPFKRDIVAELHKACKDHGIKLCLYYSHNVDWMDGADCNYQWFVDYNEGVWPENFHTNMAGKKITTMGANLWDPSPNSFDEYLLNKAYPQVEEILTNYPDLGLIWYDMARFMTPEQSFKFYQLAYQHQPQALVNDRVGSGLGDYAIPGDNKIPADDEQMNKPWETVGTMNNSWGFKHYDHDWKSPYEILYWILEIASKGGNYVLNVGPKPDGSIPEESVARLTEIGAWMKTFGDAIYGTTRWEITKEGPTTLAMDGTNAREKEGFNTKFTAADIWFTSRENLVYAMALEIPGKGEVLIRSFAGKDVKQVRLPGGEKPLKWELTSEGLRVKLPKKAMENLGYALEITL